MLQDVPCELYCIILSFLRYEEYFETLSLFKPLELRDFCFLQSMLLFCSSKSLHSTKKQKYRTVTLTSFPFQKFTFKCSLWMDCHSKELFWSLFDAQDGLYFQLMKLPNHKFEFETSVLRNSPLNKLCIQEGMSYFSYHTSRNQKSQSITTSTMHHLQMKWNTMYWNSNTTTTTPMFTVRWIAKEEMKKQVQQNVCFVFCKALPCLLSFNTLPSSLQHRLKAASIDQLASLQDILRQSFPHFSLSN